MPGAGRWLLGDANFRRRISLPAVGAASCRGVGFHEHLRRTAATALVLAGVDLKTAGTRLDYSDPLLTLRVYAQATTSADEAAAEAVALRFTAPEAYRLLSWTRIHHLSPGAVRRESTLPPTLRGSLGWIERAVPFGTAPPLPSRCLGTGCASCSRSASVVVHDLGIDDLVVAFARELRRSPGLLVFPALGFDRVCRRDYRGRLPCRFDRANPSGAPASACDFSPSTAERSSRSLKRRATSSTLTSVSSKLSATLHKPESERPRRSASLDLLLEAVESLRRGDGGQPPSDGRVQLFSRFGLIQSFDDQRVTELRRGDNMKSYDFVDCLVVCDLVCRAPIEALPCSQLGSVAHGHAGTNEGEPTCDEMNSR